jgi:hypothetical protein
MYLSTSSSTRKLERLRVQHTLQHPSANIPSHGHGPCIEVRGDWPGDQSFYLSLEAGEAFDLVVRLEAALGALAMAEDKAREAAHAEAFDDRL